MATGIPTATPVLRDPKRKQKLNQSRQKMENNLICVMNSDGKSVKSSMENSSINGEPQAKKVRQNEIYRNCSEGTITLHAFNVAKELTFENSTLYSSVEYINNVPWKIGIKCMPGRKLGVFLYLEESDVGKNMEVYAEYYFSLINQQNNQKTISKPPRCDIVKAGAAYGDSAFIAMDEMLHPFNNYLVDDQVKIEAYISCGTLITNIPKNDFVGNTVQREKELSEYMCNRVGYIITNGIGSDCNLVFTKNGEEVVKKASKAILARISPVFEKMFFGDSGVEGQVKITNVEVDVFDVILLYAYGVKCDLKSKDRAVALYLAACAYEIKDLQHICAEYMWPRVLSDVWLFLYLSDVPDLEQMKLAAVKVFARCASEGFISEQFTHISHESLTSIVSQIALNVRSELEVFDGVLHWAKTQCVQQKLEETLENLRKVAGEALNMIRFLSMAHGEFESSPMLSNILTPEEKVVILTRIIYKKKSSPLERLCSLVKPRLRM